MLTFQRQIFPVYSGREQVQQYIKLKSWVEVQKQSFVVDTMSILFFSIDLQKCSMTWKEHGTLTTGWPLWSTVKFSYNNLITPFICKLRMNLAALRVIPFVWRSNYIQVIPFVWRSNYIQVIPFLWRCNFVQVILYV